MIPDQFTVDFKKWKQGDTYSLSKANTDFGSVGYVTGGDRLQIAGDDGQHLRIKYPKGGIGSEDSGGSFRAKLAAGTEYTLQYELKFDPDFEWVKGGKLPGLCGGECYTGGVKPDGAGDGFSARYMWRQDGELVIYLYHLDQAGIFGDDIAVGYQLPRDEWVTLKQRIKLNTGDHNNGFIEVWVNGKPMLYRDHIRFMNDPSKSIDLFYFSTFFGGNSPDWAPTKTVFADYRNIIIQKM